MKTWPMWAALPLFLVACAHPPPKYPPLIIGVTTKAEVIEQYGEPDLLVQSSTGETATYRFSSRMRALPPIQIPTAQAGPFGTTATKMEPVQPGLEREAEPHPPHAKGGFQIRYDRRGVVQEVFH